jgi:hypothetical protein
MNCVSGSFLAFLARYSQQQQGFLEDEDGIFEKPALNIGRVKLRAFLQWK